MDTLDVLAELERSGAILVGRHFVYTSGKHGSGYINMDPLFSDVRLTARICELLVAPFLDEVEVVAAPAVGGVALSVLAALAASGRAREVNAVWADKACDDFRFERAGFAERIEGRRVLVVEDLLTTGGSVVKVCREVERLGGILLGVSVVCNRGGLAAADLGVARLEELARADFEAVDAGSCPLCAAGVPIVTDVGHGARFQLEQPDYPGGFVRLLGG
jgi:orotate phosphoribosyltransferase